MPSVSPRARVQSRRGSRTYHARPAGKIGKDARVVSCFTHGCRAGRGGTHTPHRHESADLAVSHNGLQHGPLQQRRLHIQSLLGRHARQHVLVLAPCSHGWMDACMNRWMNRWMNGWMDEWMDGWMVRMDTVIPPTIPPRFRLSRSPDSSLNELPYRDGAAQTRDA